VGIIIYLDETGDHSMDTIDKDYPVFGLIFLIVDETAYVAQIVPAVTKLKLDHFGHDGVICIRVIFAVSVETLRYSVPRQSGRRSWQTSTR
jgi:hypothetical protein